jgi:hypothetical protein
VLNVTRSELDGFIMNHTKLRFVMNALLEKAVRFTRAGTVELKLVWSDQNMVFSINLREFEAKILGRFDR